MFGVGSKSYGDSFNAAAKDFSKWMRALGASEMAPVWEGDVDSGDVDEVFELWSRRIVALLKGEDLKKESGHSVSMVESVGFDESDEEVEEEVLEPVVVDMEDIAGKAPSRRSSLALTNGWENGVRDMVTPVIRVNLEKQVHCVVLGSLENCVLFFYLLHWYGNKHSRSAVERPSLCWVLGYFVYNIDSSFLFANLTFLHKINVIKDCLSLHVVR